MNILKTCYRGVKINLTLNEEKSKFEVTKETNIHIHSQAISLTEKYAQIIQEMPLKPNPGFLEY